MSITTNLKTLTASEARENLYSLIKSAAKGTRSYEILLRGNEPVVLLNKAELESWQETLDILTNPKEITAIRKARKEKKLVSHEELKKRFNIT